MSGAQFAHVSAELGGRVPGRRGRSFTPALQGATFLEQLRELGRSHKGGAGLHKHRRAFLQGLRGHFDATRVELWRYGASSDMPWTMSVASSFSDGDCECGTQPCHPVADTASRRVVHGLRAAGVFRSDEAGESLGTNLSDGDGDGDGDGDDGALATLAASVSINGHACGALVIHDAKGQRSWAGADVLAIRRAATLFALHITHVARSSSEVHSISAGTGLANCHCWA